MVKVTVGDHCYYMDGYLHGNLNQAKEVIKKDWDFIFAVDGYEGSGKSVLAQQLAYYCDPTLNIDRIAFTPREFRQAILKAEPYQAVIFDEAYGGLASRSSMSKVNKALVSMLAEIRQKNLYIFIVLPTFFDLDRYVALWRSRALIHIYTDNFSRGFFSFYNMDRKKQLYVLGKKFYSYAKPGPNFRGRYTDYYVVDKEKYKKKKKLSLGVSSGEDDKEAQKLANEIMLRRLIEFGKGIPQRIKGQLVGMSQQGYQAKEKRFEEEMREEIAEN